MSIPSSSSTVFSSALRLAVEEARPWMGLASPNPAVGAVALDAEGKVLAVAAHKRAGEPHAEAELLSLCRKRDLRPHTVCVTLEPCNHEGRTPPCTEALIEAGVQRVIFGVSDPNPTVDGGGAAKLRQAGIDVVGGMEADFCAQSIHAFLYRARTGMPWVTVKRAFTPEGSMIPPAGQKTFTSPAAIRLAHRLRKRADVILTGSGTILADDPAFTVRAVPDYDGKKRFLAILDNRKRVTDDWLQKAEERGFIPLIFDDLQDAFEDLASREVLSVLVEAGPSVSNAVLASPYWTESIIVQQAEDRSEETTLAFRDPEELPFDQAHADLEIRLARESDPA